MRKTGENILFILLSILTSFFSFSQVDTLSIEDKHIAFQEHFINASKFKAIENYQKAIYELESCRELIDRDSLDIVHYELARNYFLMGNYEQSLFFVEMALEPQPDNFWYLRLAKEASYKNYNYSKAIFYQKQLIANKPALKEDLVLLYIQANAIDDAEKLILELESESYHSSKLDHYKDIVNKKSGKAVKKAPAKKDLNALKADFEKSYEYRDLIEILRQELENQNFSEALRYVNTGLDLYPSQPNLYYYKAIVLYEMDDFRKSIEVLELGLDFIFDNNDLLKKYYLLFSKNYDALKDFDKKKIYNQKALDLQ